MKPCGFRYVIAFVCGVPLLFLRCAVVPFGGGGGTETGNPGMYACAFAVYNEIETPAHWSPESYLPSGSIQLDPGRSSSMIAQGIGINDGALSGDNVVILRHRSDTLIVIDSLCIDTFTADLHDGDTHCTVILDEEDTMTVPLHRLAGKRVFPEVVMVRDTTITATVDSFLVQVVDSTTAPIVSRHDTVPGVKTERNRGLSLPYRVTIDSLTNERITIAVASRNRSLEAPVPPDETIRPFMLEHPFTRLFRASSLFGYIIEENYTSNNGVTQYPQPSRSPGSHLLSYLKHPEGASTFLSVLFDAGADRQFPSIGDNRIASLHREQSFSGRTIERVSYRNDIILATGDSIELMLDKHQNAGLVKDAAIRYTCVPGADLLDHRSNRIVRIHKALSFRDRRVQSIDLHIAFDISPQARPFYDNARIIARMYYGNERSGMFEGRLSACDNKLVGTYKENGEDYPVDYDRSSNSLRWGER
ncbi:MAG: hypothetical protein JW768_07860 [Chitinispirillaceae bacterium]|nr:hypothetical protein [Chitinispirillaceae bacterium]